MRRRVVLAFVAFTTLSAFLVACGGDDGGSTEAETEDPADLEGKDWVVTQILDAEGNTVIVDFGINASFDGSAINGVVACNSYNADYEASGSTISFGPIASTKALCPPEEQEVADRYLQLLDEAATFDVEGRSMSIADAAGTPTIQFSQG